VGKVADYVVAILEEVLDEPAEREKRFPWAVGDLSPKTGRRAQLPFDAVWDSRRLIVEIDEDQHREPIRFWDKPDVPTVSGVSRGEQRAIYDRRKRVAAREHGYNLIEICWERRPPPAERDREVDRRRLAQLLVESGVVW
jgi:hypothetical protein